MRILIDEDTAVQLVRPLQHVLIGHEVKHIHDLSWKGKKDLNVLPDAKKAGYQLLITKDHSQLSDPRECDAIKKSGLHHVRYEQRVQGARRLALALGAIIAAMPMVMEELLNTDGQRLVRIASIDSRPRSRFEVTDPRRDPPAYWPR
jgi:PIN like domain